MNKKVPTPSINILNMACIYIIKNEVNNKVYVGATTNHTRRSKEHTKLLSAGTHHSTHLQNAFNKYGKRSFSMYIIEKCKKADLFTAESEWQDIFKSYDPDYGYNMGRTSYNGGAGCVEIFYCLIKEPDKIMKKECITECCDELGVRYKSVERVLYGKQHTHKGYSFGRTMKELQTNLKNHINHRKTIGTPVIERKITYYRPNGQKAGECLVSEYLNISGRTLKSVADSIDKNKNCGGYILRRGWGLSDAIEPYNERRGISSSTPLECYNQSGELLRIFNNAILAAEWVGSSSVSKIRHRCKGYSFTNAKRKRQTRYFKGYFWKYVHDDIDMKYYIETSGDGPYGR